MTRNTVALLSTENDALTGDDPASLIFVVEALDGVKVMTTLGLTAYARPPGGEWSNEALEPFKDRRVLVLNTAPYGHEGEWSLRDATILETVAKKVKVFTPVVFENRKNPPADLAEMIARWPTNTTEMIDGFIYEASSCLESEELASDQLVDGVVGFASNPPELRELDAELTPIAKCSANMLPDPLRGWISDIAMRLGCPIEFVAVGAIITAASLVGRKLGIRPQRNNDWLVIPNLWGGVVAHPGSMKSAALQAALRPLQQLETEAFQKNELERQEHAIRVLLEEERTRAAKEQLRKKATANEASGATGASETELRSLAVQAATTVHGSKPPAPKRYVVNDATVPKLGEILAENPQGVLLFRDELSGFISQMDKSGHEGDREFYLEAWDGNGRYIFDRILRGTIRVEGICLSILGGIQPGPMAKLVRDSVEDDNDGFLARFQLMVYPDESGPWQYIDRAPDDAAARRALSAFKRLDALSMGGAGAGALGASLPPYLHFSESAQELFDEWRKELEAEIAAEAANPVVANHLGKYRSLMPSLALIFHLVEGGDEAATTPVALESTRAAAAFCAVLKSHARRIYRMAFEGDLGPARRLAERLRENRLENNFTARDILRKGWAGLKVKDDVDRALAVLEEHGWVYRYEPPHESKGGRPTARYLINRKIGGAKSNGGGVATKPTKPPPTSEVRGFVGFVATPHVDPDGANAALNDDLAATRLETALWDEERLAAWDERAAIMEFDGGLARHEAEQRASRIIGNGQRDARADPRAKP